MLGTYIVLIAPSVPEDLHIAVSGVMKAVPATRSMNRRITVRRVRLNHHGADSWKPVVAIIAEQIGLSALDVAFEDIDDIGVDKPQQSRNGKCLASGVALVYCLTNEMCIREFRSAQRQPGGP